MSHVSYTSIHEPCLEPGTVPTPKILCPSGVPSKVQYSVQKYSFPFPFSLFRFSGKGPRRCTSDWKWECLLETYFFMSLLRFSAVWKTREKKCTRHVSSLYMSHVSYTSIYEPCLEPGTVPTPDNTVSLRCSFPSTVFCSKQVFISFSFFPLFFPEKRHIFYVSFPK